VNLKDMKVRNIYHDG